MNNKLKFVESGKCSCKQQKTKEKIHNKYVVFGCGVMGHGQRIITDTEFVSSKGKKIKAASVVLTREKMYQNILTGKTYFKINGKIQLPIILLKHKDIEIVRKQVHNQIDEFFDSYKNVNRRN